MPDLEEAFFLLRSKELPRNQKERRGCSCYGDDDAENDYADNNDDGSSNDDTEDDNVNNES